MGFRFPGIVNAKESLNHSASSKTLEIPRGHFAVYVGKNQKKRFVIPVSYFNEPLFLDLLNQTEEELGYVHPMGGITIPCSEDSFVHLTSCLSVIVNTIEGNLGSNFISKASSFWNVKMMTRL